MTIDIKSQVDEIDGTPKKRLFWSIISDYDPLMALLELVDNAIDMSTKSGNIKSLEVTVTLDITRQIVSVSDNAGGVPKEKLPLLITPGGSEHKPSEQVIGVFGVGSKRASVALGEHIEIKTRQSSKKTFQIDITREWLETDNWQIPVFEAPNIGESSTIIEISKLRRPLTEDDLNYVESKLSETYGYCFALGLKINLNGKNIIPTKFDSWAYPTNHEPISTIMEIDVDPHGVILVNITAGLIRDRIPEQRNYGVYFYCNDRLIQKEVKSREVGYFNSAEAGTPHPDISLARVIVELHGPAGAMPWNSSKSRISFDHIVMAKTRPTIVSLSSRYSKVSRSLKKTWDETVMPFDSGEIKEESPQETGKGKQFIFPPLPKQRLNYFERILKENKDVIDESPWVRGLVEAMGFAELVSKKRVSTKNRIALIILDSTFEISLKEFIVHRKDLFPKRDYTDIKLSNLFQNRSAVIQHVTDKICNPDELLTRADHYYNLRNKLIHERATVSVANEDIDNYQNVVSEILSILHDIEV